MTDSAQALRAHAADAARRSVAPYSGRPVGAALRLDDGRWTAAPRIEISAFPTTIPALIGAVALGATAGQMPVAAAQTQAFTASDLAFLAEATGRPWRLDAPDFAVAESAGMPADASPVALTVPAPADDAAGVAAALDAARHAVVPASGFRVGAVAVDASGRAVRGANVEFPSDWTRGLCAERVAVVAAHAAGLGRSCACGWRARRRRAGARAARAGRCCRTSRRTRRSYCGTGTPRRSRRAPCRPTGSRGFRPGPSSRRTRRERRP